MSATVGFRGISNATLDAKGRMALPSRYREVVSAVSQGQMVVTIDRVESCLLLYPRPAWDAVQEKLQALPNVQAGVRQLQRLLIGHATDLELDGNGRLLLPALLREHAGLDRKLTLVGQGNKIEIWDEAKWRTGMAQWLSEENGELAAEFEGITGLSV